MKESALNYLSCPVCHSELSLQRAEYANDELWKNEILGGDLECTGCARSFPIRKGVPRFVDPKLSTAQDVQTGERFAVAWKEFPRLDARYRQQFFDWLDPVDPSFIKGKIVLEGGCGKGRHAQIVALAGAREVFAIDIGEAVDVSFRNVGHHDRIHIIQADLRALPFAPVFDFAFSVGVLHHMDSPESGFRSLVSALKPDGAICVWVYGKENNWWLIHILNPIRIAITSRMPAAPLKFLALLLALPVFIYARLVAAPYMQLRQKLPWLPELFYGAYLSYIARFDLSEIHHIVFDHLVAPVSNYIPGDEVRSWFEASGLPNPIIRWHNRNSWTGFADRNPERMSAAQAEFAKRQAGAATASQNVGKSPA